MKFTGILDLKGREVKVGDSIIHCWGWYTRNGQIYSAYKWHTITEYREKNTIKYLMGSSYNSWSNGDVTIIDNDYVDNLRKIGILQEEMFFIIDNTPIRMLPHELLGCSEEDYKKLKNQLTEIERKYLFGNEKD